jgi:lipopolysaccharide transport system ATP-binding protein
MSRSEINRKFDEIIDFAEIEKFVDTPVKRYSSGMYVRLAFAVAAHLEPEILVVDEVLAVGDYEFQKKCLGKMGSVAKEGRTILFVSHNMVAVRTLCDQALVLNNGHLEFMGKTTDAINNYLAANETESTLIWHRNKDNHTSSIYFQDIQASLEGEQPHLILKCDLTLVGVQPSPRAFISVDIVDRSLTPLMQAIPESQSFTTGSLGIHKITVEIELPPIIPGVYLADFWIGSHYTNTIDYVRHAIAFEVEHSPILKRTFPHYRDHGFIAPISRLFYQAPQRKPNQ